MIARISGRLEEISDGSAIIDLGGGVWYDVLIPACDTDRLNRQIGQEVIFHTIDYVEGNPSHGLQRPRLIGFLSQADRGFFMLFTTVKGIGIRKALRALVKPVSEIAAAIQGKDVDFLASLPEIGRRTAQQVIAELSGKVEQFAGPVSPAQEELPDFATQAVTVLVQLGERPSQATALIRKALADAPDLDSPEKIIQHAYKLKATGW